MTASRRCDGLFRAESRRGESVPAPGSPGPAPSLSDRPGAGGGTGPGRAGTRTPSRAGTRTPSSPRTGTGMIQLQVASEPAVASDLTGRQAASVSVRQPGWPAGGPLSPSPRTAGYPMITGTTGKLGSVINQ